MKDSPIIPNPNVHKTPLIDNEEDFYMEPKSATVQNANDRLQTNDLIPASGKTRMSTVYQSQSILDDLFGESEPSKPPPKEQPVIDIGLDDLLNIDFSNTEIVPKAVVKEENPFDIVSDNPEVNQILSSYTKSIPSPYAEVRPIQRARLAPASQPDQ